MRIFFILMISIALLNGQPKWKSSLSTKPVITNLNHSINGILLPTTTTLGKFEGQLDIIHHFFPKINDGFDALYGLDGPVINRFAFHFGYSKDGYITLARSNQSDNYSLELKHKIFKKYNGNFPMDVAVRAGSAWNSQVIIRERSDSRNFQFFGQLIINTLISNKVGLGIVPGIVRNPDIFAPDAGTQITLGMHFQYYFNRLISFPVEFVPVITEKEKFHTFTAGVELETGGHFFKIFVTNNVFINPTQSLSGGDLDVMDGDLRFGFMITRLLVLKKK
ncbi:MAG: hypothetical protein Kow00108_13910 [Calditrichia bacterium]